MEMHNPPHPGEILKEDVLPKLKMTVGEFAKYIGVSRTMLSRILNSHAGITADMDLRLSEALGQTPGLWLRMQAKYDLWQAKQRGKARRKIRPLQAA